MGAPACGEQQGEGGVAGCLEQQSGGEAGAAAAAAGAEGSGGAQELQQGSAAALLVSAGAPRNGAAAAAAAHGSVAAALVSTSDQDEVPSQRQACAGAREAQGNSQQGAQPGRYGGSHMGTGPEAGPEAGRSGSAAGPQGLLAATCSTENDTGLGEQALSWDELGPSPNLVSAWLPDCGRRPTWCVCGSRCSTLQTSERSQNATVVCGLATKAGSNGRQQWPSLHAASV